HREGGKRIERASADIERVIETDEELHAECGRKTNAAADETKPKHTAVAKLEDLGETFDGEGRESIEIAIAACAHAPGGIQQRLWACEFGEHSIERRLRHGPSPFALRAAPP